MRISQWDRERQDYLLFEGQGDVCLPSPFSVPRSGFMQIPISRLSIEVEGSFDEVGRSDHPEGVLVQEVNPISKKEPQEDNPLGEFVWAALQYTLLFGLISQLFKKD